MNISKHIRNLKQDQVGREMYALIEDLFPLCRSITGQGVRDTLRILQQHIPLQMHDVATGTQVFDWVVPKEWNIKDAYIKDMEGRRIIDFHHSNLHVVSYSRPVKKKMSLDELRKHLFTIPDRPESIPYRTSYYKEDWGFCLSHKQLQELSDSEYEVCIDASLSNGHLTYGEYVLEGKQSKEVLFSCHICHPSLCNDNLSGIALTAFLAKYLSSLKLRYTYRFLLIPGTIGSIAWLSRNESRVNQIKHGLVLACVGDPGPLTYKKSRRGDAEIDKAAIHTLRHGGIPFNIIDFSPYGYDERQFCSPGFNLPVGCLMRTPHGQFPEYHTSADNLEFVKPEALGGSFATALSVLEILEQNKTFLNMNPKCEPQLGKRGLYRTIGGQTDSAHMELALLWVLNLSDGSHTLLDIAERSGLAFSTLCEAAETLLAANLIMEAPV